MSAMLVSYGTSVIAPQKEDRDPLVMIRQENDLYLFPRNPDGTICQRQETWNYGNCAETNPWIHLANLKPGTPINTCSIDVRTRLRKPPCLNCQTCRITFVD